MAQHGPLLNGIYLEAFLLPFLLNTAECQKELVNKNHPQCVSIIGRRLQATPGVVLEATVMQRHYSSLSHVAYGWILAGSGVPQYLG